METRIMRVSCKPIDMVYIIDTKTYVPIASCVAKHIFKTSNLNDSQKLMYFLADILSALNLKTQGARCVEQSGAQWSEQLNLSEVWVFKLQKQIETAGYFDIVRAKGADGLNEINVITPTLPQEDFQILCSEKNRVSKMLSEFIVSDDNAAERAYLDEAKMFVRINLVMLKLLLADEQLSPTQKRLWLYCYLRSYCALCDSEGEGSLEFIASSAELSEELSCGATTITKGIAALQAQGYLNYTQFRTNDESIGGRRKRKSLWSITTLFPDDFMQRVKALQDRENPLQGEAKKELYQIPVRPTMTEIKSCDAKNPGCDSQTSDIILKTNILKSYNKNPENLAEVVSQGESSLQPELPKVDLKQNLLELVPCLERARSLCRRFDEQYQTMRACTSKEDAQRIADQALSGSDKIITTQAAHSLLKLLDEKTIEQSQLSPKDVMLVEQLNFQFKDKKFPRYLVCAEMAGKAIEKPAVKPTQICSVGFSDNRVTNAKHEANLNAVSPEKADKAKRFAHALKKRNLTCGYAAEISVEQLIKEFVHHAANWVPTKAQCKSKSEAIDLALTVAWKQVVNGKWSCPRGLVQADILNRELEAGLAKYQHDGVCTPAFKKVSQEINTFVGSEFDVLQAAKTDKSQAQIQQGAYHG